MTIEALGNKRRVATKNRAMIWQWFGKYPLKYRDIHDANILSLIACRLSITYSLPFGTLTIIINRLYEIIIEIALYSLIMPVTQFLSTKINYYIKFEENNQQFMREYSSNIYNCLKNNHIVIDCTTFVIVLNNGNCMTFYCIIPWWYKNKAQLSVHRIKYVQQLAMQLFEIKVAF